jgi:hypothetical protein
MGVAIVTAREDEAMTPTPDHARELLLADLERFTASLRGNEELGEKRFNFYFSLVTAVAGGLVALAAAKDLRPGFPRETICQYGVAALLIFGLITYMRTLQRNRATEEYKKTLDEIRSRLADGVLAGYRVPVEAGGGWVKTLGGGYAQTLSLMNGACAGALLRLRGMPLVRCIAAGVVVAIVLAVIAHFAREQAKSPQPRDGKTG